MMAAFVFSFSGSVFATAIYDCRSADGAVAELHIYNAKTINWHELTTSAQSQGDLTMLNGPLENTAVYVLGDFFKDQSSFFALAVPFNAIAEVDSIQVLAYRDQKGRVAESNLFDCVLRQ